MMTDTPALKPITIPPRRKVNLLDEGQLGLLKSATLEVLQDVGIHCPSKLALDIYAEHGGQVDYEKEIVKLPSDVVKEAMSHAPRTYTLGGRTPEFDLILDGTSTYLATDGTGTETIDYKTNRRRASCKNDVALSARISDYLSSIAFYWPMVSAQDYKHSAPLHELDASFNNTLKHVQTPTVVGVKEAHYAIEIARVIAGDETTLRQRPPLSILICTIAPLAQDKESMEAALVLAEAGIPVGFMSMALAGSTAPATAAGTIVVGDAEMVSAMVLIQMAYPGAPTYHSFVPGVMHPRTGAFDGYALDTDLMYVAGVQMAHMWNVPTLAGVGPSPEFSGWDSAVGVASNLLLCVMAGADTGSGFGLRETCTLLTPDALVLDTQIIDIVRKEAAGLEVDQEALALDVIKAVGPKGHFLSQPHTRENLRRFEFAERGLYMYQSDDGQKSIQFAREKTEWILENHHPQPLEEEKQNELKRILSAADGELASRG
jgi:trimethylamine--corrinoid protein Co-methyltransferase